MDKINYYDTDLVNKIIANWKYKKIDVCISTYNRKSYLEKVVNSLLASSQYIGNIIVADDGSDDGSLELLESMLKRGKIQKLIKCNRIGTANVLNAAINNSESEIILISNDDMYFHRHWQYAVMYAFENLEECGMVTIYDYAKASMREDGFIKVDDNFDLIKRSGMGCTAIKKEMFDMVCGFNLPAKNKMGFFASTFCEKIKKLECKNKLHYITRPNFATHIDHPKNSLCDRDILEQYNQFRSENKKGKSTKNYLNQYNIKETGNE
jgi:glycosyltransferase involved in cell wall biosynthesis